MADESYSKNIDTYLADVESALESKTTWDLRSKVFSIDSAQGEEFEASAKQLELHIALINAKALAVVANELRKASKTLDSILEKLPQKESTGY